MIIRNKTVNKFYIREKPVTKIQTKINGTMQTVYYKPEHVEIPYCETGGKAWANTGLYISPSIHSISTRSYITDFNVPSTLNTYLYFGARTSYSPGATKANIMIKQISGTTTFQFRRDWGISTSYATYDTEIMNIGEEFIIELNPVYTEINGVRKDTPAGEYKPTLETLLIGAMGGDSSTPINGQYKANSQRIYPYVVKIWETGEVILDVKVVRHISDEIRLYDEVRQDYLPNVGTENFIDPFQESHPFDPPRVLPVEVYANGTPLKSIRNETGRACIDAGFIPNIGKDIFEVSYQTYDVEKSHMFAGWGDHTNDDIAYEWWYTYGPESVNLYLNCNQNDYRNAIRLVTPSDHKRHTVKRDKYQLYTDGSLKGSILSIKDYTTDRHMFLFARAENGLSGFFGDIYSAYNINESGNYDIDAIPYEHNDGRVGLLNLPTMTMFTSVNPLYQFTPIYNGIPPILKNYGTPILGIKSVNGAYIDSGIAFTNKTSMQCSVMYTDGLGRAGGTEDTTIPDTTRRIGVFSYEDKRMRVYSYDSYSDKASIIERNKKINIMTGFYGRFIEDDKLTSMADIRNTEFTSGNIYCFGGTNIVGTGSSRTEGLITYEFNIMNELVSQFRGYPLIHNDGRVGVFDIVTKTFFENANTDPDSEFIPITEYSIASALVDLGIMPSSDTNENIKTLAEMGVRL